MADYAIGDLQGCLQAFDCLLARIDFHPDRDRLYLAGDLINRGPDSLGTLRRVFELRDNVHCVLGNHDLHLLAVAHGATRSKRKDTLAEILDAPDRGELLNWLQHCPLLIDIPEHNAVLTHAGIPPLWSLEQARSRAREVEAVLQDHRCSAFFTHMYGNHPAGWDENLTGTDRWRVITNHFTRMRFVDSQGALDLTTKGEADAPPSGYSPWFRHPARKVTDTRLLFGHWAALEGRTGIDKVDALDTGCVWGGSLTALRLDDLTRIQCDC
ncbi:symmetrical bis(5'-nucleosyl)-tetraphosphatase [Alcanivorax sp. DP30]|uniref:symmetrical bis(5'-nucleosyl)-tetraphosphatase n=1 Tax=Alcanivorax sp. DP30 TaxID=2606217 RepID=UPI00136A8A46|nr:symmetrical bis(5'-nucleosyl)-tetraphosphatase [Alcanivorax sp. DP30]